MIQKFKLKKKKKDKKKKGFTLVELLAVIVILAVIMVITIPTVIGSMRNTKEKSFHLAGESIYKYLKESYDTCKLGSNLIESYENNFFNEKCELIDDENLSNILINNSGYSINDIESVAVSMDENGDFGIKVIANYRGKFSDVKPYVIGNYVADPLECWEIDTLSDGTYELKNFKGINYDGSVDIDCSGYISQNDEGKYSLFIPLKIKGINITKITKNLFDDISVTNKANIISVNFNNYNNTSQLKTIGEDAFSGTKLTSITIPSSVETIGSRAFSGISTLKSVNFAGTDNDTSQLKTIGGYAFSGTKLTSITIPSSVETIESRAFSQISTLKSVNFVGTNNNTSQLKTIGEYAFGSTVLTSITIPSSVETIGNKVFYELSTLKIVNFAGTDNDTSQLKTIGEKAFYYSGLTSIIIPKNVIEIGKESFYKNSNLESVTFVGADNGTSQLKTIGHAAFQFAGLTTLKLPSNVENIGSSAFADNLNLINVTFIGAEDGTSKLTTIAPLSFMRTGLTSIIIPSSVETIGSSAFSGNSNLENIIFLKDNVGNYNIKTIESSAFHSANIKSITIPFTIETIGKQAFYKNVNLTTLIFEGVSDNKSNLKGIGEHAFSYCDLNYKTNTNPLIIPFNVETIGKKAFYANVNLKYIKYDGSSETILKNTSEWYNPYTVDALNG